MTKLSRLLSTLLSSLQPKPKKPTINSYGESASGLSPEQIQDVMEWLFASLFNAGYFGEASLIWDFGSKQDWGAEIKDLLKGKPVFLYRCEDRPSALPEGYYWRLMAEHPSLRVYQLELSQPQ